VTEHYQWQLDNSVGISFKGKMEKIMNVLKDKPINFSIEIKELNDGRFEASLHNTKFKSQGYCIKNAFDNLLSHIQLKDWKDRQTAEIKKQYPNYFQ
jgi:hypothetical protein